jgi:hypothetical protein
MGERGKSTDREPKLWTRQRNLRQSGAWRAAKRDSEDEASSEITRSLAVLDFR